MASPSNDKKQVDESKLCEIIPLSVLHSKDGKCIHPSDWHNPYRHFAVLADVDCIFCYYGKSGNDGPDHHCTACQELTKKRAIVSIVPPTTSLFSDSVPIEGVD